MSTQQLTHLINKLGNDWRLAFEYFTAFSRFEFALKQSGYATVRRPNQDDVWPDWETFLTTLEGVFSASATTELQTAVAYLTNNPPKHQVLQMDTLLWVDTVKQQGETDLHYLFRLVKTIRNNLFHGGKYPFDPQRDRLLLEHGLTVLDAWIDLDQNVRRVFYQI